MQGIHYDYEKSKANEKSKVKENSGKTENNPKLGKTLFFISKWCENKHNPIWNKYNGFYDDVYQWQTR